MTQKVDKTLLVPVPQGWLDITDAAGARRAAGMVTAVLHGVAGSAQGPA